MLRYRLSKQDYVASNIFVLRGDKKMRRNLLTLRIMLLCGYFYLAISAVRDMEPLWPLIAVLASLLPMWFAIRWLADVLVKKQLRAAYAKDPLCGGEIQIQIEQDKIRFQIEKIVVEIPIDKIKEVKTDGERIYFTAVDGIRVVPFSAFCSEAEREAFLERLKPVKQDLT